MNRIFAPAACLPDTEKWEWSIMRLTPLYRKSDDIRSDFSRDYNRILHCNAYRRLKHKTQVFYATGNDHICTRIEHVQHVAAISSTISTELGLNTELSAAIALGHDIGHAPFGHQGEKILRTLYKNIAEDDFWHEKNSLFVADYIETLAGLDGIKRPLNLTYAVRDGMISHCGEVDENGLMPRTECIDLYDIMYPNQYQPFTWEGCVVKIADKIAYLGRDIEDALRLNILNTEQLEELKTTLSANFDSEIETVNTTYLVHSFILDLCNQSSPEAGLCFSEKFFRLMKAVKDYNYKHIYRHPRLAYYNDYARLIIETLFSVLKKTYLFGSEYETLRKHYPLLVNGFRDWFICYSDANIQEKHQRQFETKEVFRYTDEKDFSKAVLIYISLMSDQYALKMFNQVVEF